MTTDWAVSASEIDTARAGDFHMFVDQVFHELHGDGTPFIREPFIEAVTYAIEQVVRGERDKLLISMPPRHLKSMIAAIALPAWLHGHDPTQQVLVFTYGHDLASEHASKYRQVVESAWYRRLFPGTRLRRTRDLQLTLSAGGFYKTVTPSGPSTGFGCDLLIIDDSLKAMDAHSAIERDRVRDAYRNLTTRFNDSSRVRIISIQQRLHEADLPADLIESGEFHVLEFKAIADTDEVYPLSGGRTYRRRAEEVLSPRREPREVLDQIRRRLGRVDFAAQYQQSPSTPEGNIIRWEWFQRHDLPASPEGMHSIVMSWDQGQTAEPTRDYSACIIAGEREGVWYILDLWRGHLEFAALKQQVNTLARRWRANRVLLEGDHVGRSLKSDITGNRMLPAATQLVLVQPEGGKLSRMIAQTDKIAEGRILIPRDADWLEAFRRELIAFPSGRYDDQVDALSQLLSYINSNRGRALANTNHATGRRAIRSSRRQRSSRLRLG